MAELRRPPHYRSAHARFDVEESPVAEQIESGLAMGKRIRFFIKGVVVILTVLMFSLIDSPIRPFMVGTAVVMGLIILLWPLLNKTKG